MTRTGKNGADGFTPSEVPDDAWTTAASAAPAAV